ncbi:MAG: hypothetical protein ACI841_000940 [Planctomycetota bacterium]|jgi:hypothetical protein
MPGKRLRIHQCQRLPIREALQNLIDGELVRCLRSRRNGYAREQEEAEHNGISTRAGNSSRPRVFRPQPKETPCHLDPTSLRSESSPPPHKTRPEEMPSGCTH